MLIDILEPMGVQFDRLRCEVCQNLFLRPMNTGFLRHAVATVLTVYGIETRWEMGKDLLSLKSCNSAYRLRYWNLQMHIVQQQALMKSCNSAYRLRYWNRIVLRSIHAKLFRLQQCLPFTVLKPRRFTDIIRDIDVATVLTVYGIETY